MARREYPMVRDDHFGGPPDTPTECCGCTQPAVAHVRVAYSYMRGEDEMEPICERHRQIARDKPSRFIAHMLTKHRHTTKDTHHDRHTG